MPLIRAGVGRGEPNYFSDVKVIQQLINLNIQRLQPMPALKEDGLFGWKTQAAIGRFQRAVMMLRADKANGQVRPGDDTYNALCWGSKNPKFNPQPGQKGDFHSPTELAQTVNSRQANIEKGSPRGINPITGTPGFDPNPPGTVGHLRKEENGKGEFNSFRNNIYGHHTGLDIQGVEGQTPILAHQAGTVITRAKTAEKGGNTIVIDHHNGVVTIYCHCSNTDFEKWVKPGDKVEQGQQIAIVGRTGNAGNTPPHLHFIVKYQGKIIDPDNYLNGVPFDKCKRLLNKQGVPA